MSSIFTVIAALFVAIFMTVIGRLLSTHTGERYYHTTPLHCFIAGLGIWYLWFLLFTRIGNVSIDTTVYLFAGSAVALFFVLPKVFHIKLEMEHFWTLMVATLLMLLPTFVFVGSDEPTFWREFATDVRNADYLFWLNKIPSQADVSYYAILGLDKPMAMSIAVNPIYQILQNFSPAVFACWSLFLIAITMGGLARSAGINVRWSNLPLVASGGLIAIVGLNPFLQTEALFSAYKELWIASTFFCAMMPLFSKKALPQGWEVIPTAFVLVFLVGLVPEGIYLAFIVMALWFVRMLIEQSSNFIAVVFALTVLIILPLIAFWLWYGGESSYLVNIDTTLPQVINSQLKYYAVLVSGSIIGLITLWHFIKIVLCGRCSRNLLFIENAWYVLPAIIFVLGVVTSAIFAGHWGVKYILYSQFILLLPVWVWLRHMYDNMWVHQLAFKAPWAVGFFLAIIVVGAEFTYKNTLTIHSSPTLEHIKQVGEHIASKKETKYVRMVVLDGYNAAFHADAMGYALRHHMQVTDLKPLDNLDKNTLHKTLKYNKIDYLWIHRVTKPIEQALSVRLEHGFSYLFKIEDFDFKLDTIYPHPSYQ